MKRGSLRGREYAVGLVCWRTGNIIKASLVRQLRTRIFARCADNKLAYPSRHHGEELRRFVGRQGNLILAIVGSGAHEQNAASLWERGLFARAHCSRSQHYYDVAQLERLGLQQREADTCRPLDRCYRTNGKHSIEAIESQQIHDELCSAYHRPLQSARGRRARKQQADTD